jgi:hypothetical protein
VEARAEAKQFPDLGWQRTGEPGREGVNLRRRQRRQHLEGERFAILIGERRRLRLANAVRRGHAAILTGRAVMTKT